MASPLKKPGIFLDWNDDYKGKTGNGWDHGTPGNPSESEQSLVETMRRR
jgi:hypothetical protein